MMRPALAAALAAALMLATPALAQWKWKDANGQVHVSDLPPPRDVPEKSILQRPPGRSIGTAAPAAPGGKASAPAASASAPTRNDPELEAKRKKADADAAAKEKAADEKLAAAKAENCRRARSHLANLENGQRIARTNERGEREFMSDQTRATEVRQTREVVASDCR